MSQAPRNPFEHHHSHGPIDEAPLDQLDPAQQSVADALRISFTLLKIVMLIVAIFYLFSGVFSVPTGERAIRLRFGRIVGDTGQQVIESGGLHFAMPFPFEEVVRIPAGEATIYITDSFWPHLEEGKTLADMRGGELNPEKDGSLLTADANVLHARWAVNYRIGSTDQGQVDAGEMVKFVRNVGTPDRARDVIRAAVEEGAVYAAAQVTAEQLYQGKQGDYEPARVRAQKALDAMDAGIHLTSLSLTDRSFPIDVKDAVQAVLRANNDKEKMIQQAQADRTKVLNEMAGPASEPLLALLDEYELAPPARQAEIDATLDRAFRSLTIKQGDGELPILGEVSKMISQANADRVSLVQDMQAEVERFTSVLPGYEKAPQVFVATYWLDAINTIFGAQNNEVWYDTAGGRVYLELNRDKNFVKEYNLRMQAERDKQAKEAQK